MEVMNAMLLQATGISKSFGAAPILSNITIQLSERERVGLVGVNGAGKSTLLQIIAGELTPDSGTIYKAKETQIGYLAQNSGLQSDRTIWEEMMNVYSSLIDLERELRELEVRMADPVLAQQPELYEETLNRYALRQDLFREQGGYEMEARARSILHGMGFGDFPQDTPIQTLSGGQKTRLALARILLQAPELLLLDEPTNYLDIQTLTWLEDHLRNYPGGILVVSHDRYFLDALVHTIYEIERHSAKRYVGNYSKYIELKTTEYESQLKLYEKQQDEIARMEEFIQRNLVRATTTKRAQSRRKALERMERIDKPIGEQKKAQFSFQIDRFTGKDVLQVNQLSAAFDGKTPLFQNVSFDLRRGETAALIGPNGVGKSTLLKILIGQLQPLSGTINWGTHVKLGYYDQEQTDLNPANTVLEELWSAYPHLEEVRIRTVLGSFLFSGDDVLKKVGALSGGEKARVALAKLMLLNANVLVLDEPTNHLDLYSKEVLEASLIDYEGTLLFVSHDRYFLNKMAERVIELTPESANHFLGNYDEYVEKKRELEELEAERQAAQQTKKGAQPNAAVEKLNDYEVEKQAKREERTRKRKLEQLEADIAALEAEIVTIEEELSHPDIFNDYIAVQEKTEQLDTKKETLQLLYEEWSEWIE